MRLIFLVLMLSQALSAEKFARPEAEFVGRGQVKSKPDFISVSFNIQSECYESPELAQEATDKIVTKLVKYLNALKTNEDEHFKVLVDGGFTVNFSQWINNRELCRNTFQKSTEVILKIRASEDFSPVFANMQSYALKNFEQYFVSEQEQPRSYVRINTPIPELTPAHRRSLEHEAMDLAMIDAKASFRASMKSCKPHPWKVVRIREESGYSYDPPRPYRAMKTMAAGMSESSDNTAPVRFDDLTVEKRLNITFGFEDSMCYES